METYLSRRQVAEMLGLSEGTLCHWRKQKRGPEATKCDETGRVRYSLSEVQAWITEHWCDAAAPPAIDDVLTQFEDRITQAISSANGTERKRIARRLRVLAKSIA